MNPFFINTRYLLIYMFSGLIITGVHFFYSFRVLFLNFYFALADSLVYNLFYLPFGLAIWYIVRYNNFEIRNLIQIFMNHFLAAVFIVLSWLSVSYYSIKLIIRDPAFLLIENESLPSRFLLGLLYYLLIMLAYYLIMYYQNFREKIQKEAEVNTLLKEAELNALKLQINPHFIFNSLNSINSLILIKPDLAQEMIVKLSDFLRSTLRTNSVQMVPLKEELNFCSLYLDIEKIRFGSKFNYQIDFNENLQNISIPHMILQPVLENAIKHGVQQSTEPVGIDVKVRKVDQQLVINIVNNKYGDSPVRGKGIGLKNIRERLQLLYNRSNLLEIEDLGNQFSVTIRIPITA